MITERDVNVLNWVGEMYAIRVDLLCFLLGRDAGAETTKPGRVTIKTAERRVKVWVEREKLVEREKIFFGEPAWIWLTKKGLSLLEYEYRFLKPRFANLNHFHAVNQVRLWFERQHGQDLDWQSERRLRLEFGRDEKMKKWHVPDAEIVTGQARIALEVELTPKTARRTKELLLALATSGRYQRICYFAEPKSYKVIAGQLPNLSEKNQAKFALNHLTEITKHFG